MSHDRAAERALRDFGAVDELVASCQRELTIAQARHTSRSIVVTAPFLIACWFLVRNAGDAQDWALPWTAQLMALYLAGTAVVAALLAAGALAATGTLARWLPTPEELPRMVGWTGTTASISIAVATLALATASVLATNWPLIRSPARSPPRRTRRDGQVGPRLPPGRTSTDHGTRRARTAVTPPAATYPAAGTEPRHGGAGRLTRSAVFAAVCVSVTAPGHALMSDHALPARAVWSAFAAVAAAAWCDRPGPAAPSRCAARAC